MTGSVGPERIGREGNRSDLLDSCLLHCRRTARHPDMRATPHGNADHQIRLRLEPVAQGTVSERLRRPGDLVSASGASPGRKESAFGSHRNFRSGASPRPSSAACGSGDPRSHRPIAPRPSVQFPPHDIRATSHVEAPRAIVPSSHRPIVQPPPHDIRATSHVEAHAPSRRACHPPWERGSPDPPAT